MKKTNYLLSIATGVSLTLGMIGCGGDTVDEPLPSQTQNVPARMVAVYAPGDGLLPVPNDILFGGTQDLTLNLPVDDEEDYGDPTVAISSQDGWSAVAPFSIDFSSRDDSLAIDGASVVGGDSVRVYKVNVLREDINEGVLDDNGNQVTLAGIPKPTGPVTSVERELVPNQEYVVQATSATTIAIIPLVPLVQQASYMVVLTNGLQDSDGEAIVHDAQYAIAQSQVAIADNSDVVALEPVRQLVNAMESAAAAAEGGPARADIIMSYQFTVQSIGTVMNAAQTLYVDLPFALGATPETSFSSLFTDTTPFTGIGDADLYKGSITLSYLLGTPSVENPTAPLNTFWRALEELPIGPGGADIPNPFGENLTYANSFPRKNGDETVPLLVSMPKADDCPMPAAGYPVAIVQHGITQDRTNLLGIADALARAPSCTAGIAMDLPLHGIAADNLVHAGLQAATNGAIGLFEGYDAGVLRERTFGVDYIDNETGAPGDDEIVDAPGAHTINLANLLVARDNSRQAILDLLYLEKAIAFMDIDGDDAPDFDADNISYIGHSLGGIIGTGVLANSDNIKSAVLANPGSGIAMLLDGSEKFGPIVRAGVAAGAGLDIDDPALAGVLAQFYFAAQTVLDAGDPANTSASAVANNIPTLMFQVADDTDVPNSVMTAPLSGTEPLARLLGLTTVTSEIIEPTNNFVEGDRLFTKLNAGLHSTFLSPDDGMGNSLGLLDVTTEMQSQTVQFLLSDGAGVTVLDTNLLDE